MYIYIGNSSAYTNTIEYFASTAFIRSQTQLQFKGKEKLNKKKNTRNQMQQLHAGMYANNVGIYNKLECTIQTQRTVGREAAAGEQLIEEEEEEEQNRTNTTQR